MTEPKRCGFDGCDKPFYAKGWCKNHYRKLAVPTCKEEGCDRPVSSRGWCGMHYERWRQHGDTGVVLGRRPQNSNPDERWCAECKRFKPLTEFGTYIDKRSGISRFQSSCGQCMRDRRNRRRNSDRQSDPTAYKARERESNIRRLYDMSSVQFDELLASQNGTCANTACGTRHVEERGKRLHVDHDHKTGAVRGLLCSNCNTALGRVDDDLDRLAGLMRYILKHRNEGHSGGV